MRQRVGAETVVIVTIPMFRPRPIGVPKDRKNRYDPSQFGILPGIPVQSREAIVRTSFKWRLAVLVLGITFPAAAFALEAGIREVPAKQIAPPTAGVSPQ